MSVDRQNSFDSIFELHEYIKGQAIDARLKVAEWNAKVADWHERNSAKPIPLKAFEEHPAAEMIAGLFIDSALVENDSALEIASTVLAADNEELRESVNVLHGFAAQLFDVAELSANPAESYMKARLWGVMANASGFLLELRTTTSDQIYGLQVENMAGCILARTLDVREGECDA